MTEQALSPDKLSNYALHKSLGLVLFMLGLTRLLWAILTRRPPLPASLPRHEQVLARVTEALLFLLLVLMPLTGWLMSSAANTPVSFFGWITLPDLIAPDRTHMEQLRQAHAVQSYILLALIILHVLAAARHFFLLRDNVLYTILPLPGLRRK